MADIRHVNRLVRLKLASGRIKPAKITALGAGTLVDVRVINGGGDFAAVALFATPGTIGWKRGRGSA